jgi:phosphatidylcholine synthase
LAWTFFAGWAAWVQFDFQPLVYWGLILTTLSLLFAGAVQQVTEKDTM